MIKYYEYFFLKKIIIKIQKIYIDKKKIKNKK